MTWFVWCPWGSHWSLLVLPEVAEEVSPLDVSQWGRVWWVSPVSFPRFRRRLRLMGTKRIPRVGHRLYLDPSYWFHLPI